jgi:hypothetical protein
VFHVSLLKLARSDPINPIPPHPAPEITSDGEEEWEVEEILDKRVNRRTGVVEYWIKWVGFGPEWNEWVPVQDMQCPDILAEFERAYARLHPEGTPSQQPPRRSSRLPRR